ncbi:hypothetical protein CC86DRAFT_298378 [Ophiobolus disseminans]|uniref:FabD/lysophospholipase-like protein n=1 Tax=Ophiobolus disseminans TaxID=1469910 RepID=A0A6A6ZRM9_9PLEO|nr:hypothetical protein CC86DRAFT_298378 [Ophiobolus disseminans]
MRSRLPSDAQTGRNSIVERFLADATSYAVTPSSEESDPSQKSAIAGPHPSPKADDYEARLKKFCESCDLLKAPVWNCRWCDMDFCDPCWYLQGPHKPGRTGPDGYPHEKADPIIVARFKSILTPTKDQTEQQGLCLEDDNALWFGVARDALNSTVFTGYERYSALMNECNTGEHVSRCPQLVSFIGQIGTGKSTLIKMLIDQQEMQYHPDKREFLSPVVVSSRDERSPTSSGVRLYSDPATCQGEFPRLYADCEGPEEGYHLPAIFHTGDIPMQTKETVNLTTEEQTRAETSKERQTRRRKFERAGLSEEKKRQYAVTELYPRILYAFSDVVVFVLRDSKTIEASALSLLIAYASSSLETSLNQPILPHAVIAVNAVEVNINQEDWDPLHTTKSFMSHTAAAMLLETPAYRRLAEAWRKRGRRIATIQDLLVLYYSSITVVRIPIKGRYMLIDEQVKRLYGLLTTRLNHSLAVKRRSRMLANSEEFDLSIQSAFNHFSRDLHIPFNFLNSTYGVNTKSLNFGANILKLAVMMKSSTYTEPRSLFTELSFMVASCIVLDSIRQGFKGSFKWILGEAYLNHCDHALDQFCAAFWPCSFVNRRGRCVNMTERHNKGHQNARGEIIGVGQYQSDFTWDSFAEQWHDLLRKHTSRIVALVHAEMASSSTMTELAAVIAVHAININTFFGRIGGATKYVSHSACFCCLRGIAEHPLPCGHILCTACVKGFGKAHTRLPGSVTTTSCPLHSQGAVFGPLWEIHIKPALAGVRVLSLDGGGIRGIVVLEVLKSIEEELGGRIPVMNFFDLVVGTSIGGILALGLGVKEWSIQQSIELFPKLIDKIFTSKVLGGTRFGTSKYSTHHVEDALKECFKDDLIFGGFPEVPSAYTRKVAVTATTESGEHGVIITNYNRASDEQGKARATSAAPIYFKPFAHTRTGKSFLDGGIYHNNPVRLANRESQTIWSDVGDHHPDLLLSLGTGRDDEDDPFSKNWPQHSQAHLKSVLDAEQTWRDFRMDVIGSSSFIHARRYVRINPKITIRRPKLDEKAKVFELQENIRAQMDRQLHRVKIGTVAHQLVASSFYFELFGLIRTYAEDPRTVITGTIACRFAAGSDDIRNLGRYVRKQHAQSFQQFFNIQELDCEKSKVIQIPLTADILSNMIDFGIFDMGMIEIPVTQATSVVSIDLFMSDDHWISQLRSGLPISGFPRSFLGAKESDRRGKMPGIKTGYMK